MSSVDAFVRRQRGEVGEAVALLVALVRSTVPDAEERLHHGAPWFFVAGQPVCYVAAHAARANLGFRFGADLDDPDGLLEGTGKSMRHVKVARPRAVPRAKLARLLRQAAVRARGEVRVTARAPPRRARAPRATARRGG